MPRARNWPANIWGDYMRGDDGAPGGNFRSCGGADRVALIALSSAVPTGPFMATGRLGERQLARFGAVLEQTADCSVSCLSITRR